MSKEADKLIAHWDHIDQLVMLGNYLTEQNTRQYALDLWKHYPKAATLLYAALAQTQHTRPVPRLLQK